MSDVNNAEFYALLEQYIQALKDMLDGEQQKLEALYANDLKSIEKALSISQANSMNLENVEKKRIYLQQKAGLAGLSFSEIIDNAKPEDKNMLMRYFEVARRLLEQIRYLNSRSMNISASNLRLCGISTERYNLGDSLDVKLAKKGYTMY